jgi:hypothetical protein
MKTSFGDGVTSPFHLLDAIKTSIEKRCDLNKKPMI